MKSIEQVDILDGSGEIVRTVSRSEAERDNHTIQNVLVFLFTPLEKVWVQLRPEDKKDFKNCWDVSACGAVHSGESKEAAAARETLEETGLKPKLTYVESFMNVFPIDDGRQTQRLSHLFISITDEVPQADGIEVAAFKDWEPAELRRHAIENPLQYIPSFIVELDRAIAAYRNLLD